MAPSCPNRRSRPTIPTRITSSRTADTRLQAMRLHFCEISDKVEAVIDTQRLHRRLHLSNMFPSQPQDPIEIQVDRMLALLRETIRRHGYTHLDVQEKLSWGRSYISQLLTKQKSTRFEQLFQILEAVGVDPADFFAELFGLTLPTPSPDTDTADRVNRLIRLMVAKNQLTVSEAADLLDDPGQRS